MTTARTIVCREGQAPVAEGDTPFKSVAINDLTRLTAESDTVVTLLGTEVRASLRDEHGSLMLTATGRRFTYALRIGDSCVHATVRDRDSRRVRLSTCLNGTHTVTGMLESIICDAPRT